MAQLVIEIPDPVAPRVLNRFADYHGYTGTRPDGTAETKSQFLKRRTIEFIRDSVKSVESAGAARTAAAAVDSEISLT